MLSQDKGLGDNGRIIAVFGSAGLRDREKRRMMAETSAELADLTVLTGEDPRTESLDAILEEMADGARSRGGRDGETFWRVPDRGEAIRFALGLARPGDIILSCGKGHEQSMCYGKTEYSWDDRTAMRAALADRSVLRWAWRVPVTSSSPAARDMSSPCAMAIRNTPGMIAQPCGLHWLISSMWKDLSCHICPPGIRQKRTG